jgi:nitrate reductase NapAB chaperone NapD
MEQTNGSIDICGVLVHASKDKEKEVKDALSAIDGVEVHHTTQDSRLLVTVELQGRQQIMDTMGSFNDIPYVISTVLTYQHSEEV